MTTTHPKHHNPAQHSGKVGGGGGGSLSKLIATIALLLGAGALAWFAALPTAQAQTITDYDPDDNGRFC